MGSSKRIGKGLALVAAGAVLGAGALAVAAKKPPQPAKRAPTPAHSIRDTGVGLPRVGSHGTLGVGEFVASVRSYHDNGSYASDLQAVGDEALDFMVKQAKAVRGKDKYCRNNPKKKSGKKGSCPPVKKLAIVLDIDETALSNYEELNDADFAGALGAILIAIGEADSPAIAPTLAVYERARQMNIAVFFVTGRLPSLQGLTVQNLNAVGYSDPTGFYMKPSGEGTIPFKSGARADIESKGYRIIANIGDQESDLSGGHADRSFKLPNPFYFIE